MEEIPGIPFWNRECLWFSSGEKDYESVAAWFIKTFDVSVQRAMIIMNTFNEIAVGVEQLCSWKPLRALYRLSLFCGQGFENCSLFCILYLYIYIMALKCLDELLLPCCQHCWGKKECYRLLSVGFHKKSGLLTRGNTIRQKGKIFSTWLRTKFPGKWFPGVPASGSVGVACKPTCCLLSPSFNEYTRNCSLGTKKAQIGDKISAPAHWEWHRGGCRPDTVLEPKFGRFLCVAPSPVHKSARMKGELGQFSRPGLILVRSKIE